jgi:hypothetical protein
MGKTAKAAMLALFSLIATYAAPLMMDNMAAPSVDRGFPAEYVTQMQDNFDTSNKNTWEQAYYVNDTFFEKGSDAPVFICMGGEGPPIDSSAVTGSVHCNVAVEFLQEKKALMFALEHRYYGCHNSSACPFDTKTRDPATALKFLSSRQAIADASNFYDHAQTKFGLTKKNKWVSFGGSYPGMLASFVRMKYPEKIHASISSSAPVKGALDMPGYNDVTAQAYGLTSVGGSDVCNSSIAKGHADIGTMMNTTDGRTKLAKLFPRSGPLKTYEEQKRFAGNGVASFPAQSNDPTCKYPGCNIEQICKVMANTSLGDEVERLAMLRRGQEESQTPEQTEMKAKLASRKPANERLAAGEPLDFFDYWGYQTCAEWGFYQTCETGSQCMYTQGLLLLDDFTNDCMQYGLSVADVTKNIDSSNAFYGAWDPLGPTLQHDVSRIMWVNGDVDPWHSLSVLETPADEKEQPTLMVSGASHHAWTHPSASTDQASVVAARQAIRTQVTAWLAEE